MDEAKAYAAREDKERALHALESVFRRLLANLLLDFENPKYRRVRVTNAAIRRNTEGLSTEFVSFLLATLGFTGDPDAEGYIEFSGTKASLSTADQIYTAIESAIQEEKNQQAAFFLNALTHGKGKCREKATPLAPAQRETHPQPPSPAPQSADADLRDEALKSTFHPDDFASVKELVPTVTKTLLTTGRVRNCFFEAKGLTVRRMEHGRVYACSEKCGTDCLEAHWHLYSGKGMMYAYVAHLSPDGTTLLHMGAELGYQYNGMPGTENFGKTVHFTEKLVKADGTLAYNKHPNKVVAGCTYCNEPFSKLFL